MARTKSGRWWYLYSNNGACTVHRASEMLKHEVWGSQEFGVCEYWSNMSFPVVLYPTMNDLPVKRTLISVWEEDHHRVHRDL